MKRPLTDTISVAEMMRMRESGMSNAEIARAVGAGYSTVARYLGAQPGRGGRVSASIPQQAIDIKPRVERTERPVEKPTEEVYEGVLPVVNRRVSLKGEFGEYEVDQKDKKVTFAFSDMVAEISYEEWQIFAKEVTAISRHISKEGLSPEIW